ncbi:amidase [Cupriavidus sp. 2MCAB6]|uniref:amidase n=1 Tax=Cupriavidus sp. 2MCAB6 TaxID=3232981 RepID=UPI003F8F61BC
MTINETNETTALNALSATTLLDLYARKALSPVEVTQAVLSQMEAWEPHIHAAYALDTQRALAMARESEARWQRGAPQGALDGVPVTIKENIATQGVPVPLGCAATELVPAAKDAPPAARLREAGAVFLCKTTMPDLGMLGAAMSSFHPLTRNPWDLSRNTGGSSSGAGAAAAAGYGPLHVGTDIGGSVRGPAGFCGIFGLKPSLGRIPIDPPYAARAAGPMTRTVADAALMMRVLSQPDARDHMSLPYQAIEWNRLDRSLKGLRIGLWLELDCGIPLDPDVREAVERAARAFEAAGAVVEPIRPWIEPGMLEGISRFWAMRTRMDLSALPEARRGKASPAIQWAVQKSQEVSAEQLYKAHAQGLALRAATVAATRDFDYVFSPVFPQPAFGAEQTHVEYEGVEPIHQASFTIVYNFSEQPAASVNCGYAAEGMPIGLQIAGRRFDDLGVLQMARAWEEMRPAQRPWPQPPRTAA